MAGPHLFQDINLLVSPSHYAFKSASSASSPTLVVERPSGDLRLDHVSVRGARRVSSIAGILGLIKLKLDKYIIVISKTRQMGRLNGHMIHKVVATEFLPLRETPLRDPDEDAYLTLLKKFLASAPMYFSYSFDITSSFQRQSQIDYSSPLWKRADDRFFWNRFIQTDLIDFRMGDSDGTGLRFGQLSDLDPYILPVMFGMMHISTEKIKNKDFTFALITRRSRYRGGTRYFSRGIDENGNVSNYNETEQIVILNDHTGGMAGFEGAAGVEKPTKSPTETQVLAYVQTRGSVPVYWGEINNLKYTPKLQVRPIETGITAARKHFTEQIRIYGENYLVNLVNQKGREQKVKEAYEQVVRSLVTQPLSEEIEMNHESAEKERLIEPTQDKQLMDHLHYIYFDFHNETKGLKWHRAELLLEDLTDGLIRGGYFRGVEIPGEPSGRLDARSLQTSVVRTNCMDCLDRTNVIQSMLGRWTLTRQFVDLGFLKPGESATDDAAFANVFRNVWADNADAVSSSYSGTGALKTDFTRTGQRTPAGVFQDGRNSLVRYIRNNFLDGPRQDAFDVFLGAYLPANSFSRSIYQFIDKRPLVIQSIPYVLAASAFMVFLSMISRQGSWQLRVFFLIWTVIGAWSFRFIVSHGILYVNWPKLNTPAVAIEESIEALNKAHKDKVIGKFVPAGRRQRGMSNAKLGYMEEGKKRVE